MFINFAGRPNAAFGVAIQQDGEIVAVGDVQGGRRGIRGLP